MIVHKCEISPLPGDLSNPLVNVLLAKIARLHKNPETNSKAIGNS